MFRARYTILAGVVCAWAAAVPPAVAQVSPLGSGTPAANRVLMGFERNVNTFTWNLGSMYGYADSDWRLSATERLLRTLIIGDRDNIRNEQEARIEASYQLLPLLALAGQASSFLVSDNRSSGLNDISSNSALAGLRWTPLPELAVSPMAGIAFEKQQEISERGPTYNASIILRNYLFGINAASVDMFVTAEHLDPRVQTEQRVNAELLSSFSERGANQAQVSYRRTGRDLYLPTDSAITATFGIERPIETRNEAVVNLADRLSLQPDESLEITGNLALSQRNVGKAQKYRIASSSAPVFDSNVDEFRLAVNGLVQFQDLFGARGNVRFDFSERTETYSVVSFPGAGAALFSRQQRLEQQKNNAITQMQVALNCTAPVSTRDTLAISTSAVKLAYDTPSVDNFDDRDEVFFLAAVRWMHRFSPFFSASLSGDANLRHTVYIFGARSANNTWNRVFRVTPATELRVPGVLHSKNQAEVVANYTVYDFERINPSLQSFSLRQLTISDSTVIRLTAATLLTVQLQLKVYERGELHWEAFTIRPLSFFDERSVLVLIGREIESLSASVGFRYFQQNRYRYLGSEKREEAVLQSYGPTCGAALALGSGTSVSVDGWYQLTSAAENESRATPNINLRLVWNL